MAHAWRLGGGGLLLLVAGGSGGGTEAVECGGTASSQRGCYTHTTVPQRPHAHCCVSSEAADPMTENGEERERGGREQRCNVCVRVYFRVAAKQVDFLGYKLAACNITTQSASSYKCLIRPGNSGEIVSIFTRVEC